MQSGRTGAVMIGTVSAVSITEWSLDISVDTEELAYMNATSTGWKERMNNMQDWSATVSGKWDMTDATNTVQQDLQNNMLGYSAGMVPFDITLLLYADTTTGHKQYYSGNAMLKSMNVKTEANGIVEVEFQFQGDGQLSYLTA